MKPLENIRVTGLVTNLPGPLVMHRLHGLGAATKKVEPPEGDALERAFPEFYERLTAGQKIVKMDLKDGARLREVLAQTDLLVTTIRPKTMARLGLEWSALHAAFPKLSHLSIVGYPAPDEDRPGHDLTYQAVQGLVEPPQLPTNTWADIAGGLEATIAALGLAIDWRAGVYRRETVSLSGSLWTFKLPVEMGLAAPEGVLRGALPNYQVYETRDGWVALAALEPHFWSKFQELTAVKHPNEADLRGLFLKKSAAEWESWAREHDLPLVRVRQDRT
ncbi:MAG TPA: CoA transferase [Bdellovibrionales bacterium]|nr:CoA transferase [Bdellovibrionales bacterium]